MAKIGDLILIPVFVSRGGWQFKRFLVEALYKDKDTYLARKLKGAKGYAPDNRYGARFVLKDCGDDMIAVIGREDV